MVVSTMSDGISMCCASIGFASVCAAYICLLLG